MISTSINKKLLEEVLRVQIETEDKLLRMIAQRVDRGISTSGWTKKKLDDTIQLRMELEKILSQGVRVTTSKMSKGLIKAYMEGIASANKDHGMPLNVAIPDSVPFHLQRLIMESQGIIERTSFNVLRNATDAYRDIIFEASTGVLNGVDTQRQAAQTALNNLAAKGITGFTDKVGRNWELASYVEMALRTTNAHAALQGHLDRQAEIGNDLVMVSSHASTCKLCAPWGGKPLSISGNTLDYPSLQTARAAGLFHPNCKHTLTAYFPGIDEPEGHTHDHGYNPEGYEAIENQRYNERQIRKWKRTEAVALTPVAQAKAHNKVLEWQSRQREHIKEWNLKRNYYRESIKNR